MGFARGTYQSYLLCALRLGVDTKIFVLSDQSITFGWPSSMRGYVPCKRVLDWDPGSPLPVSRGVSRAAFHRSQAEPLPQILLGWVSSIVIRWLISSGDPPICWIWQSFPNTVTQGPSAPDPWPSALLQHLAHQPLEALSPSLVQLQRHSLAARLRLRSLSCLWDKLHRRSLTSGLHLHSLFSWLAS